MFGLVDDDKDLLGEPKSSGEEKGGGVKVWIKGEKTGLGPGGYALFKAVDAEGSVKKACVIRGLSYSKGWKIINGVEKELGFKIIDRQQGGAGGGEAHLTEKGKRLLKLYELYYEKVAQAAKIIYDEVFEDFKLF